MANTILQLTKTDNQTKTSLEVYSDISLVSKHANIPYKSLITLDDMSIGALSGESKTFEHTQSQLDYILDDPALSSFEDSESRRLYLQASYTGNAANSDYNKRQKQKAQFQLVKSINVKAVQQSLHNIFSWLQGERILNPEFGCRLREYIYEGITDFNRERIVAEIRHCITEWEPRVQLVKVVDMSSMQNIEDNTVVIDIIYSIPSLSEEQYNYTYMYHTSN